MSQGSTRSKWAWILLRQATCSSTCTEGTCQASTLQAGQDPLEHAPVLRLVGVLLRVSLRTRPDIAWAAARITRLASSDETRARVCIRNVVQYLRWTLHFALFYEPVKDYKWRFYTDASWAPEGDYSHQAVATYYLGTNLVAWKCQRQSLVAFSSAEAELIASVWGNRLALSLYGQLNEMILSKPTYMTHCDNSAVVQLTQQLSASKTRTRYLSTPASWLHHLVKDENVSMGIEEGIANVKACQNMFGFACTAARNRRQSRCASAFVVEFCTRGPSWFCHWRQMRAFLLILIAH